MKNKTYLTASIIFVSLSGVGFYLTLPAINIQSSQFLISFGSILFICYIIITGGTLLVRPNLKTVKEASIPVFIVSIMFLIGMVGLVIFSPIFSSNRYAARIDVSPSNFSEDITPVDLDNLPLLDKESTQKVGDRVMGQLPELISQFEVSDQYTQISYQGRLVRVTPLEYNGFFKWLGNNNEGSPGYILVDSTTGEANLVKLEKGMKYLESSFFNDNLSRKIRFQFPTEILAPSVFEIDDTGAPYFITPVLKVTWVDLLPDVKGTILTDPVTGKSTYYDVADVPGWVDHVYPSNLILNQINDWGSYQDGWLNSFTSQKNVRKSTSGYTYLAEGDDIYIYTGITSAATDESNIGFILTNLRTKETHFYAVPGAEEFSAMNSAQGAVQEKRYSSTFPLLINLNGRPTYLSSLKDAAGLVKAYAFVDVEDYQKVKVSDSSLGLDSAANAYLQMLGNESTLNPEDATEVSGIISSIESVVLEGSSYFYLTLDSDKTIFKAPLIMDDRLPFLSPGTTITFTHTNNIILSIESMSIPLAEQTPVPAPSEEPQE